MYLTLIGEMAKKRVEINNIAELLNVHRNSVANKLYGKSDFTVTEAFQIRDHFFSDIDFETLFSKGA